jgi:transposase InsO family protein
MNEVRWSYGVKRMTEALKDHGFHINKKRVERIMKEHNIRCRKARKKRKTTDSSHKFPASRPDSSFVAVDADTLGSVLVNQHKFNEPKSQFEKARLILKKNTTVDPHMVAAVYKHLQLMNKLIPAK